MEGILGFIIQNIFNIILTIIGAFLSVILTKFLIQNGRAINEGFRRMDEGFRRMDEGFRRMDEGFRLIALLVVEEDIEKKKEIVKKILESL